MNKKVCIIIVGPTAVGKTSVGIAIAKHFNTVIISADSRQCYKELNIGVAKPSTEQLQEVKHYFINSHHINEEVNAAVFEQYALQNLANIFKEKDVAVMVGGTGLYIKAFTEGMDNIPPILPDIRQRINDLYDEHGLSWLQQQIQENDTDYYNTGEILNPQRLIRALEVKLSTGKSIRSFQRGEKAKRGFDIIKIGLELPRETLYTNINTRVEEMIAKGLLQEIELLLPFRNLNALQTVGYTEFFEHIDNKITKQEAIEKIKKNTRHYAKRQLTWFKKDISINWFSPLNENDIITHLKNLVR